jgi:hypothetical protein
LFAGHSSLYLELRVEGDKLSPRQHIGAVPYAQVALNATGDITPKSISVAGNPVIDATGKWVGDTTNLSGVTSLTASAPLTGGTITATGTIGIPKSDAANDGYLSKEDYGAFAGKQNRVSGACGSGYAAVGVNADGSLQCAATGTGNGTVTSVATGAGLTGGPITTSGTIALNEDYANGYAYDSRFVNIDGDEIMTGPLSLPTNGLTVGTAQLVCANGGVGIGTTPTATLEVVAGGTTLADAWTPRSSIRFKENIHPIAGATEKLLKLQGVYFDWKDSKKKSLGLIAEDVGKVFPELVNYENNGKNAKSLDYDKLTAVLIEAIKEQRQQNEALKSRIDALERAVPHK